MRVDFYLLSTHELDAMWLFVCRLIEKAYLRGHRLFVYCNSSNDAAFLDELLWTFKEDSFIPHNLAGEGPEKPPPVQIGYTGEAIGFNDILMNLAQTIPPFCKRFNRVIEIVRHDETSKTLSRTHYRWYRENGAKELKTHSV
jgi:DNA polymerase-3 subunit chi